MTTTQQPTPKIVSSFQIKEENVDVVLRATQKNLQAGDALKIVFRNVKPDLSKLLQDSIGNSSLIGGTFTTVELNFSRAEATSKSGANAVGFTAIYRGGIKSSEQKFLIPLSKEKKTFSLVTWNLPTDKVALFATATVEKPEVKLIEVPIKSSDWHNWWRLEKEYIVAEGTIAVCVLGAGIYFLVKYLVKRASRKRNREFLWQLLKGAKSRKELEKVYQYRKYWKPYVELKTADHFLAEMDRIQFAPDWSERELQSMRRYLDSVQETFRG